MTSFDWTAIGAGATAVSAVVIAWQAVLTRRSVQTADMTLREAQMARVEGRAPRVIMSTVDFAEAKDVSFGPERGGAQEFALDRQIFALPRHDEYVIRATFTVTMMNDGPGSIVPEFSSDGNAWVVQAGVLIPEREALEFDLVVTRSVEDWIAAAAQSETGGPAAMMTTIKVSVKGPADADVDDTWTIRILGSVLSHPYDDKHSWIYNANMGFPSTSVVIEHHPRVYWKSRARQERYDDPQPKTRGPQAARKRRFPAIASRRAGRGE